MMKSPNDIWEALGDIEDEEAQHVLARIFTMYEEMVTRNGETEETNRFFQNLSNAIDVTQECNLNRR
ncbi:MAG: hypothetical protein ACI8PB_001692 [Desulforhopalus sp.]|jgi:hypothetical protein